MSNNTNNNNTSVPLAAGATFTGKAQQVFGNTNLMISIRADKLSELTIQQSGNGVHWDLHEKWTCDPAKSPTGFVCQTPASLSFFRILVENLSGENMTILRVLSVMNMVSNVHLDVRQDNTLVSGEDAIGDKHTLLTDVDGALVVSAGGSSGLVVQSGQNTDFAFFPDATNSTAAIYADGDQPVATNQAGWVYTNDGVAPNKINWYVFQDVTLPQYLVSEMDSIYFVISQITPATTLPFVGFYTMPNGIDDVVPNFAKSKLVFAPSNLVPTAQGEYLFYVKSDPTHIRPEITNRYELTFVADQSTKTLAQAAGERLSLATLSTNSTDPVGSNYFLFQQYGIVWEKTSVPLPVNNGLLDCNIVSTAPVVLAAGTSSVGYVRLTAENDTTAGQFDNLQVLNGYNYLKVVDPGAIEYLSEISTYTGNTSGYTQSIDGKITACDTDAVTLSSSLVISQNTTSTTQQIKGSAGSLQSVFIQNHNAAITFIAFYDALPGFNPATLAAKFVITLHNNIGMSIATNNVEFTTGISYFCATSYNGGTPQNNTYVTAFYQ